MSNFKPVKRNRAKTTCIIIIAVFSVLLFVGIGGVFNRLAQGESNISEYIPNIIITPISIIAIVLSSLILKGKIKSFNIPRTLIFDVFAILLFVFCAIGAVIMFISSISKYRFGVMIFSVVLFAGFCWAVYLFAKMMRAHIAVFLHQSLIHNDSIDKPTIINNLMCVEQLLYIADYSVDTKLPYIDDGNIIRLYDSKKLAQNYLALISAKNRMTSYRIHILDRSHLQEFLQKLYDHGFKSIQYTVSFDGIDLSLCDFPIKKTDDPIFGFCSDFLAQNFVVTQQKARIAHLKEIGSSEDEYCSAITVVSEQANAAVKAFLNSVFYTLVIPMGSVDKNVLTLSNKAFDFCAKNDFINQFAVEGVLANKTIYPFIDKNNQQFFLITFTKYEEAKKYLETITQHLLTFETKIPLTKKLNNITYWNELKCLASCDICVMSGTEISEYMLQKNCNFISVDFNQSVSRETIESYIADSASSI